MTDLQVVAWAGRAIQARQPTRGSDSSRGQGEGEVAAGLEELAQLP
jgi:hypothetical protein